MVLISSVAHMLWASVIVPSVLLGAQIVIMGWLLKPGPDKTLDYLAHLTVELQTGKSYTTRGPR